MKKIDLGQSITMLANIGVIAGIAFLAYEIKQNNDVLREQARSGIVSEIGALNAALYENAGGIGSIAVKARRGDALTDEERYRLGRFQSQNLVLWQSAYSAYREGMIDEEDMVPRGLAAMFHDVIPGMPEQYENIKASLDPRFIQWMEENVVSPP